MSFQQVDKVKGGIKMKVLIIIHVFKYKFMNKIITYAKGGPHSPKANSTQNNWHPKMLVPNSFDPPK